MPASKKKKNRIRPDVKFDGKRAEYLTRLKERLTEEAGRNVTYQEIFNNLVDIMVESSDHM